MHIILVLLLLAIAIFVFRIYKYNEGLSEACNRPDVITIDSGITGPTIGMVGGVHGNEPAGSYTLTKMISNGEFKPKKGKIVIIHRANPCGLAKNVRILGQVTI
jgi:predicted deacylase